MNIKSCFFIGHRDSPYTIYPKICDIIERLTADEHVYSYTVGHYGSFDNMVFQAIKNLKERNGLIHASLLIPYHPGEKPIEVPDGFDSTFYPPDMEKIPRRLAIVRANHYMVDNTDYLVAYAWHPGSNARELLSYARSREKRGLIHVIEIEKPDTMV